MQSLNQTTGQQGEYVGSATLIEEIVNEDGFDPDVHLDFSEVGEMAYLNQQGRRQYQRSALLLDLAVSRLTNASNFEWDGAHGSVFGRLTEMGPNSVRWNRIAGLLKEQTAINLIPNPRCEGAVAGSPGIDPEGWDSSSSLFVVGSGVWKGNAYVDYGFTGLNALAGINFTGTTVSGVSPSSPYTLAVGIQIISGTGFDVQLSISSHDGSGSQLASGYASADDNLKRIEGGQPVRLIRTHTTNSGAAFARSRMFIRPIAGPVTGIVRVFVPQLEAGEEATTPALPPQNNPAQAVRDADVVTTEIFACVRDTRKSNAGAWDFKNGGAFGPYREFPANAPAITKNGLLVESETTNYVQNPRFEGAVPGVIGSGGVAPTGFAMTSGLRIDSVQSVDGWDVMRVAWPRDGASRFIRFGSGSLMPAVVGDDTSASLGIRAVSGWNEGAMRAIVQVIEVDVNGSASATNFGHDLAGIDATPRRFYQNKTLDENGAGAGPTAFSSMNFWCLPDNAGGELVLDLYAPQLEKKTHPTSPVLPKRGTIAASTRAKDSIKLMVGGWYVGGASPQTLVAEVQACANVTGGYFADLVSSVSSDRIALRTVGTSMRGDVASSQNGGSDMGSSRGPITAGETASIGVAFEPDNAVVTATGSEPANDNDVDAPLDALQLTLGAALVSSVAHADGYIKQIRYKSDDRISDAALDAAVGN